MSRQQQQQVITASASFGPLPSAAELVRYNDATPNAADRIIAMAERQSSHRHMLEERVVKSDTRRAWAGLICAFLVAILALGASTYLIINGHDWAGASLFGGSLASIVLAFIKGTDSRRKEREEKMKMQVGR